MEFFEAVARDVAIALEEDVGDGDLTARLIPEDAVAVANVVSREDAVLCGSPWFEAVFRRLDPAVDIVWNIPEGGKVGQNQFICTVKGNARALLTAERSALNFLQLLSAVATRTRSYVDAVSGTRAVILDTRKTIPGLRIAEKYAVRIGGGQNQRMGLFDAILIKENHILACGGVKRALQVAAKMGTVPVQIEVENLEELQEALDAGAKLILLDNFTMEKMEQAVKLVAGRAKLEASGGVSLGTVRRIAETGVDRISIGSLTKDIHALDLSMRFEVSQLA
ncbi:MAG: carboxylating nicotinate-nucleotide diphosphorylase [Burkholderiales bacterium]|nr:carboxylating nicotinate-nucleotide diphosphorylase [Burkholderiales bacterium]